MSAKGKALLALVGMKPKARDDDETEDDNSDEEAPDEGAVAAAEDLCAHLGVDESKAPEVAKAILRIVEAAKG